MPFSPSPFFSSPSPPFAGDARVQAGPGWTLEPERGLPERCVPPGMSISGNWQRERSAALARSSQHLDTYITGNTSKKKKKISRRGGFFFFLLFCTFKYFLSPHLLLFLLLGLPVPRAAAVSGALEGWGGCQVQEGGKEGAAPTPEPFWGGPTGQHPPGTPTHPAPGTRGCLGSPCPAVEGAEAAAGGTQREGLERGQGIPREQAGRVPPSRAGGERRVREHAQVSPLPPGQGKQTEPCITRHRRLVRGADKCGRLRSSSRPGDSAWRARDPRAERALLVAPRSPSSGDTRATLAEDAQGSGGAPEAARPPRAGMDPGLGESQWMGICRTPLSGRGSCRRLKGPLVPPAGISWPESLAAASPLPRAPRRCARFSAGETEAGAGAGAGGTREGTPRAGFLAGAPLSQPARGGALLPKRPDQDNGGKKRLARLIKAARSPAGRLRNVGMLRGSPEGREAGERPPGDR